MELTIDELAAAAGTTSRSIRSFQTLGLLGHPHLRGRTGLYGDHHLERLRSILGLQAQGFSLQSLGILFSAHDRGRSLAEVLDVGPVHHEDSADDAELYGFGDLQRAAGWRRQAGRRGRPLLSVVPTTVWDQTAAS